MLCCIAKVEPTLKAIKSIWFIKNVQVFYIETLFVILAFNFEQASADKVKVLRRIKFLIFPLLFLCVTSGYTYYSLFYSSVVDTKSGLVVETQPVIKIAPQQRQIASLSEQVLIIDCQISTDKIPMTANKNIMLKMIHCPVSLNLEQISVVNLSNNYQAQIFKGTEGEYLTDFIQLKTGVNELKLDFRLNDVQKKTQMIKIEQKTIEIQ